MTDIQTGITGRADGRKSKNGAVKDALKDILQNLATAGHITLVEWPANNEDDGFVLRYCAVKIVFCALCHVQSFSP